MGAEEDLLRRTYRAFNERDVAAVVATLHPEVEWPNAWEGGRLRGREAVAAYWERQFAVISSRVEPRGFTEVGDGSVEVSVEQIVEDARSGELLSKATVTHRFRIEEGLILRLDVIEGN